MKKIGNWWCPDSTRIVDTMILEESFACFSALKKAFCYVEKFNNAIDVGTWIGDSTTIISEKFTNVIGFEANDEVFECCQQNLKDRNITNCELFNIGLSNTSGDQYFFNGKSNFSGWISQKEDYDVTITKKILIKTKTLDELNYGNIDFLKVDVDSHEGFFLEGSRKFLKENNPVILIENKENSQKIRQIDSRPSPVKILNELGYKKVEKAGKADYVFIKKD